MFEPDDQRVGSVVANGAGARAVKRRRIGEAGGAFRALPEIMRERRPAALATLSPVAGQEFGMTALSTASPARRNKSVCEAFPALNRVNGRVLVKRA